MFIKRLCSAATNNFLGLSQLSNQFLTTKKQANHDLVFIRHAESEFNVACQQYRKAHKIPYVWKELCNHEGFDQKVLFNMKYVDCPLTQKGKSQCKKIKQVLKNQKIDCVLVSPMLRTLQTCEEIFKQKMPITVLVEPLLMGPIRSCSDLSKCISEKKQQFAHFNFNNLDEQEDFWYLNYLPENQHSLVQKHFRQKNLQTTNEKQKQLLSLLKLGKINENAIQYRKRIQKLKNRILNYRQKYQRVAIVSHYYTIQYMCAVDYMKCGSPKYYIDVKNNIPYYANSINLKKAQYEMQKLEGINMMR